MEQKKDERAAQPRATVGPGDTLRRLIPKAAARARVHQYAAVDIFMPANLIVVVRVNGQATPRFRLAAVAPALRRVVLAHSTAPVLILVQAAAPAPTQLARSRALVVWAHQYVAWAHFTAQLMTFVWLVVQPLTRARVLASHALV
jgi:hypothetical protein